MARIRIGATRGRAALLLLPLLALGLGLQGTASPLTSAVAASPGSGTVSQSAPSISWNFAPVGGPSGATDTYQLGVLLPQPAATFYAANARTGVANSAVLTITLTWTGSDPTQTLGLSATDPSSNSVGNDTLATVNDGSDINVFTLQDPLSETYTITASNQDGASTSTMASHAVATLQLTNLAAQPEPAEPAGGGGFSNYHIPLGLMPEQPYEAELGGRLFGEPTIGVDPRNDDVMYQAGLFTMRGIVNRATSPPTITWTNVSDAPLEDSASLDAILDLDRSTGRVFVSQLTAACSLGAVSDNDGTSWTSATKPCETPPAVDHETIGAGPFSTSIPTPSDAIYPDAAYYCSQNIGEAECALSVDGGLNYGVASPMWNSSQCFGLHGHVKVAPNDGTVYVPDKTCGAPECLIVTSTAGPNCHPAFAVSTDDGATWTLHLINDGHMRYYDTGDPSIGIGAKGTMYFGYGDRDGHPKIAVCTNQGTTCSASVDVGTAFHIQNTEMPTVVAGDDDRAAFAFMGSTMPGDDQQNTFVGTWHLYVAITYDGGKHWTTSDATPNAPIQRGCIEFNASCPSTRGSDDQRNLLDFNDVTVDREGRVVAAYNDGCQPDLGPPKGHGPCLTDATRLSGLAPEIEGPALAYQTCGLGLYAKYDSLMTPCAAPASGVPEAPTASALVLGGLTVFGVAAALGWRRRRRPAALTL